VKITGAVPAVTLPAGKRDNHLVLVQVCAVATALTVAPACAVTLSVCAAGAAPPAVALNVKPAGEICVGAGALTFRNTVVPQVPIELVVLIVPQQYDPAGMPEAVTDTVNVVSLWLAVNDPTGETVSQSAPVQVFSVTFTEAAASYGAVTTSVCEGGSAMPANASNVNDEGFMVSGADGAQITLRYTGITFVMEPAVMVMAPLQVAPTPIPD